MATATVEDMNKALEKLNNIIANSKESPNSAGGDTGRGLAYSVAGQGVVDNPVSKGKTTDGKQNTDRDYETERLSRLTDRLNNKTYASAGRGGVYNALGGGQKVAPEGDARGYKMQKIETEDQRQQQVQRELDKEIRDMQNKLEMHKREWTELDKAKHTFMQTLANSLQKDLARYTVYLGIEGARAKLKEVLAYVDSGNLTAAGGMLSMMGANPFDVMDIHTQNSINDARAGTQTNNVQGVGN